MPIVPENPTTITTLLDADVQRLRKDHPDLPKSLKDCITCKGAGQFWWYDPTGGDDPVVWTCNCADQFVLHRYLLNAGINLAYQRMSWADASYIEEGAKEVIRDYNAHALNYVQAGIGLLLHGERGTGKTLIASLLAKWMISQGFDVYFTTFQELIDTYTGTWQNEDRKAWFNKRVRNAGVLVIDDIGREHKGRLEIVESMFDHIVRARVSSVRPTILTTNKNLTDLRALYSPNLTSLLAESSIEYQFSGEDYRPQANKNRIAEARQGLNRPVWLV